MEPKEQIDQMIASLPDWRGEVLSDIRKAFHSADADIVEEWKWRGAPVWSDGGIVAVANAYKDKVKLTFYKGACLADPDGLFNAGLEGNQWRTIDFHQGDKIEPKPLEALIRAAIAVNHEKKPAK